MYVFVWYLYRARHTHHGKGKEHPGGHLSIIRICTEYLVTRDIAHTKDMKLIPSSHPAVRTMRNRVNSLSATAIVARAVKAVVIARARDMLQLGRAGPDVRPSFRILSTEY